MPLTHRLASRTLVGMSPLGIAPNRADVIAAAARAALGAFIGAGAWAVYVVLALGAADGSNLVVDSVRERWLLTGGLAAAFAVLVGVTARGWSTPRNGTRPAILAVALGVVFGTPVALIALHAMTYPLLAPFRGSF